jgi:hypothetical protein
VDSSEKPKRSIIEVRLSGKQKTCLENIWKVFYKDIQQKTGYFLVNAYQRNLDDLVIGETRNILLVNGYKHQFFSQIQTDRSQYNTS